MNSKIKISEILRIGMILFLITAVSALLLAFVNGKTAPLIAQNEEKAIQASMKTLIPEADSFEAVALIPEEGTAFTVPDGVSAVYLAKDAAGESLGICVVASGIGYNGEVKVMAGIDSRGEITGVDILSHSETPGLGANAVKSEFRNQYQGKSGVVGVVKNAPKQTEIVAMSGATITSKAVTNAVNLCLKTAQELLIKEGE